MSSTERAPEPTMEEILASIRRIISEDEPSAAEQRPAPKSPQHVEALEEAEGEADTQIITDIARVLSGGAPTPVSVVIEEEEILDLTAELGGLEFVEEEPQAMADEAPLSLEAEPAPSLEFEPEPDLEIWIWMSWRSSRKRRRKPCAPAPPAPTDDGGAATSDPFGERGGGIRPGTGHCRIARRPGADLVERAGYTGAKPARARSCKLNPSQCRNRNLSLNPSRSRSQSLSRS